MNIPTGIQQDFPLASIPASWQTWYDEPYSDVTTTADVSPGQGQCMLLGSKNSSASSLLSLVAFGVRSRVEQVARVWENGVYWYFQSLASVGFAPTSDIHLSSADFNDPADPERLSWHLDRSSGGWRSGATADLNSDSTWRKVVMYGPCCRVDNSTCSQCPAGKHADIYNSLCTDCAAGRWSDPGAQKCLATLDTVFANLTHPAVTAAYQDGSMAVTLTAPPLPQVYNHTVRYSADLAKTANVTYNASCRPVWSSAENATFSVSLSPQAEAQAEPCYFDLNFGSETVQLSAFVGLFLTAESGLVSAPVVVPVTLSLPYGVSGSLTSGAWGLRPRVVGGVVVTLPGFPSTLSVYSTGAFSEPLSLPVFMEGDDVFVQHKLVHPSHRLELASVWLSTSADVDDLGALRHNLTEEVFQSVEDEIGQVSFHFRARECEHCTLHCLSTLAPRRLTDGANPAPGAAAWQHYRIHIKAAPVLDADDLVYSLVISPAGLVGGALAVALAACGLVMAHVMRHRNRPPVRTSRESKVALVRFLCIEFVDVLLDIGALLLAWGAGDLTLANDPARLVLYALLVSTVLSALLFLLEVAGLGMYLYGGGIKIVAMLGPLTCLHMFFEDVFQMLVYAGIAVSEATQNLSIAWATILGAAHSLLFICLKLLDLYLAEQ